MAQGDLNRGDRALSPLLSLLSKWKSELRIEWMRLYLRGRMTDGCGTQSTQKGMGLVKKKGEFSRINTNHGDPSVAFSVDSRLFQELERSVSFMYKVIDRW